MKMVVCDLASIEYNVVGWLARGKAIMECVRLGRDAYLNFAPSLHPDKGYTYDWLKEQYDAKNSEIEDLRQRMKPPVLGGGFGLGGGELVVNEFGDEVWTGMCGYAKNVCGIELSKEEAHAAVEVYRRVNFEVVQFWTDLEQAFKQTLKYGNPITVGHVTWNKKSQQWSLVSNNFTGAYITFCQDEIPAVGQVIRMQLPSGRFLHYLNCRIEEEEFTYTDKKTGKKKTAIGDVIYYDGIEHSATTDDDGTTSKKSHKWGKTKTYGGKLCLSGDTEILTNNGIKPLTNISQSDKLWDGVEWVEHDGIVYNGEKETQTWMGLTGTSNHQILGGKEWHELGKTTNRDGLCSLLTGLVSVLRLLCFQKPERKVSLGYDAIADKSSMSILGRCEEIMLIPAHLARAKEANSEGQSGGGITSFWMQNFEPNGFIGSRECFHDATIQSALHTSTTTVGESKCMSHGASAEALGWNMQSPYQGGLTQLLTLIESTIMEITNQEICGSFLVEKMQIIRDELHSLYIKTKKFPTLNSVLDLFLSGVKILSNGICRGDEASNIVCKDIKTLPVYDIKNCGPRNRFTVVTPFGFFIAHNCENATQAVARDILVNGCHLATEMGFKIAGVFHDEIMALVDDTWGSPTLKDLRWAMSEPPKWAPTMILDAAGWTGKYYRK